MCRLVSGMHKTVCQTMQLKAYYKHASKLEPTTTSTFLYYYKYHLQSSFYRVRYRLYSLYSSLFMANGRDVSINTINSDNLTVIVIFSFIIRIKYYSKSFQGAPNHHILWTVYVSIYVLINTLTFSYSIFFF